CDSYAFPTRRSADLSVLMRVLSDMDIDPDLDMFVMPTRPGDRWLLCSDGLSGVVDDIHIAKAMSLGLAPGRTADILLKRALDGRSEEHTSELQSREK